MKYFNTLLFLFASIISQANILFNGNTYTASSAGIPADPGTFSFSYDSYSGPGGFETFLRVGNYWYRISTGIGVSESSNYYVIARTADPFCSDNPPANVAWYKYQGSPIAIGVLWSNYPVNPTPPLPTTPLQIVNYSLSGQVGTVTYNSTQVMPDYIDLPNIPSSVAAGLSPNHGRIYYNQCEERIDLGIGNQWSSLWPNKDNYKIRRNQELEFGNIDTRIYGNFGVGTYGFGMSNIMQLNFVVQDKKAMVLGKDYDKYGSDLNFASSVGSKPNFQFSNYSISDTDHFVILHQGATSSTTFSLPGANLLNTLNGRQLIILNASSHSLNLSPPVNGLTGSVISAGKSVLLVYAGAWYRVI